MWAFEEHTPEKWIARMREQLLRDPSQAHLVLSALFATSQETNVLRLIAEEVRRTDTLLALMRADGIDWSAATYSLVAAEHMLQRTMLTAIATYNAPNGARIPSPGDPGGESQGRRRMER